MPSSENAGLARRDLPALDAAPPGQHRGRQYISFCTRRNLMALTMIDKQAARAETTDWPQPLKQEFAREREQPNGCVGSHLLSETDKVRVWTIHLRPGERLGFHRHV